MKDEGVHFCLSETSANCDAVEGATSPQGSRKGKGRVIGVLKRKDASAAIWHEQRDFSLGNKSSSPASCAPSMYWRSLTSEAAKKEAPKQEQQLGKKHAYIYISISISIYIYICACVCVYVCVCVCVCVGQSDE